MNWGMNAKSLSLKLYIGATEISGPNETDLLISVSRPRPTIAP